MARKPRSLARLSLTELVSQRDKLQAAINAKVAEERRQLEGRISELAAFTATVAKIAVERMNGHARRGRRARSAPTRHPAKGVSVPAKYRGPNGETWSGRGLTPRWLVALEKGGKKRDSYLIKG